MVLPEMRQIDKIIRNVMCYDCFVKSIWALIVLRDEVNYTEDEITLANTYIEEFKAEIVILESKGLVITTTE